MLNLKVSQDNTPTLYEGIHTTNNKPIIYVSGNTFPIKNILGKNGLGFNWYRGRKIWWMYKDRFDRSKDTILQKLSNAGVNITNISPQQFDEDPRQDEKEEKTEKEKGGENIRFETDKTQGRNQFGVNFPVNDHIYETEIFLNIDGQDIPFKFIAGRGQKDYKKTLPIYEFSLYMDGELVRKYNIKAPGRWGKNGPNYSEEEVISNFLNKLQDLVDKKDRSRLYQRIKYVQKLNQRSSELKDFLEEWDNYFTDSKKEEKQKLLEQYGFYPKTIYIEKYNREFPIDLTYYNEKISVKTNFDHPLAPYPSSLLYIYVPAEIQTIDDLRQFIDKEIQNNLDSIREKYIKYLQSFPFGEEKEKHHHEEMEKIINNIKNRNINSNDIIIELKSRGYIRPKMRGTGWVLTREAINAGYSTQNSVENYYGTIAYWLSRMKRNVTSFTEMMLTMTISELHKIMERSGYDITYDEIESYLDRLVRTVYEQLFGEKPGRSAREAYEDFYGGNWRGEGNGGNRGTGRNTQQTNMDINAILNKLKNIAENHNIIYNPESLKSVYRQLSLKLRPDMPDGNTEKMIELNNIWDALPENIKQSNNWFKKLKLN